MRLTARRSGGSIRLGQELGRGGEGAVFEIEGRPTQVAKIYSHAVDERKARKLIAMTQAVTPELLKIAAWPVDLLIDHRRTIRGLVMPRINARRDVHELYGPKSRTDAFPEANFRFLVHTACNIARAFAVIHEKGHVVGDVNHGNLLVGPDGTVTFIDCDSFQVGLGGEVFTCDVGVALFTPPELQGKSFRGLRRTPNHDRFGMAVLLFHLLFMGRHPFAGRYSGPGEMPIERAIAEYRFAYGPQRRQFGMERPPGTLDINTFGPSIAGLFVGAFSRRGSVEGRPNARTWIVTLEALKASLRQCESAPSHHYPRDLRACPWCPIESGTRVRLFGQRITGTLGVGAIDVAALWQAIVAVPDPGPDPALPSERRWHPPRGVKVPSPLGKNLRKVASLALACAGLAACNALPQDGGVALAMLGYAAAVVTWPWVPAQEKAAARTASAKARAEWEVLLSRWNREARRQIFAAELDRLARTRAELAGIDNERRRRLAQLEANREKQQLYRYLDRFRIDRADVPGIGSGRIAMLASYGIETAADVRKNKILRIPGFGDVLAGRLVEWRRKHERNFRFNPNEGLDPRDIAALNRDLAIKTQHLVWTLQQGPVKLQRASREIAAARARLMPVLERAWAALKLAEARRDAL